MNLDSVFVLKSEEKGYVSSVSGEEGHEKVTYSDFGWMPNHLWTLTVIKMIVGTQFN